jgi:hypothetical protein
MSFVQTIAWGYLAGASGAPMQKRLPILSTGDLLIEQ